MKKYILIAFLFVFTASMGQIIPKVDGWVTKPKAAPGTPVDGEVYYDSTTKKTYQWNGTSWIDWSSVITLDATLQDGSTNGVENNAVFDALATKADIKNTTANNIELGITGGSSIQDYYLEFDPTGFDYTDNVDGYITHEATFTNQDFIADTDYVIVPAQGLGTFLAPYKTEVYSDITSPYSAATVNSMAPYMRRISDNNRDAVAGSTSTNNFWARLDVIKKSFKTIIYVPTEFSLEKYENRPLIMHHIGSSSTGGTGTIRIKTYYKVIN